MRHGAALLALVGAIACRRSPAPPSTSPAPRPAHGPAVALTLPALDGGELDLAALRGKVVVVHVFTTWSLAAQAEVDALRAADAAPDVVVVGLALDADGRAMVSPWRRASDVAYLIVLADDRVRAGRSGLGPLPSVPTTIVLDRAGRAHGRADRQLAPAELDAMIAAARAAS